MRRTGTVTGLLGLFLMTCLPVHASVAQERCVRGNFQFSLPSAACEAVFYNMYSTVTFGVDLTDVTVVRSAKITANHLIVRARYVEKSDPRSQFGVAGTYPINEADGIKQYTIRGQRISVFKAADGATVYVTRGLNTFEGNRMLAEHVELLYQFDQSSTDLVEMDRIVMQLLKKIQMQWVASEVEQKK